MLYLGDRHIRTIGLHWGELVDSIEAAVRIMDSGDYAQPIKPYLRYRNAANRIIAMPAYIGGAVQTAGIKWIASFPGNIDAGLPRAHSVTLLNDANTGIPYAMLGTPLPSAARTAAVSGLLIRHYLKAHGAERRFKLGIIGFGPVGRLHYDMCCQLFGEHLENVQIYDIRGCEPDSPELANIDEDMRSRTRIASSWDTLYNECDLIITCTVSKQRYIDLPPAAGSLLLDVSLRDYTTAAISGIHTIVVDDWDEVCRENTDIELLHLERGLSKAQTISLADAVCRGALADFADAEPVLFCPMGMAVFDMAIADYFVGRAKALGIGMQLK
ncbi:2,3-diaminopropionate biosynthesis protein SbnB [Bacillus sp. FJAT-26390]|uniref:2,3-diaminopropionate biosynthesis protein SbnB n=1 Tax=Bacillus sp. FJAT-26390 TaxID=1743142 RepID=UPI000807E13C|nr:2,3-diaminopropionate biosynthesis protein SbnB [Bacillus sp. FJAT-26390]OBZ11272.1 2,3-diaminopropionate biosynthesis protein SbnB [Bacillus sp. FJAT-26390]